MKYTIIENLGDYYDLMPLFLFPFFSD